MKIEKGVNVIRIESTRTKEDINLEIINAIQKNNCEKITRGSLL